jgi:serine protease Do
MNISNRLLTIIASAFLLLAPLRHSLRATDATAAVPSFNANLDLARQLNQVFVHIADDVSQCVVVITVTQKPGAVTSMDDSSTDDEQQPDPFEQFRRWFQKHQQDQQPQDKSERNIGQGSGIIIRKDGYILTNRHVVEDAEKIEVRLKDGRTFHAEVRGVDAPADVAVIKIDAQNLPVARLADSSKTRVGEFAIAIGAPFALDYSVTFGHVSAKDRSNIITPEGNDSRTVMLDDQSFIQTDANINPGNSGGPLVNIEGEVIGINTLIRGLHTGIGFAIPINLAKEIADKLISEGKFSRSWLGVTIESLRENPDFREKVQGVQDGVVVREIVPTGPAAKSKLNPFDVIVAVDGKSVVTSQELKDQIRNKKAGQEVVLDVFRKTRDGDKRVMKAMKISVLPGEWVDQNEVASNDKPASDAPTNPLGIKVKTLSPDLAKKYNVDMVQGVIVTYADKSGLAWRSGIQEGDIITSIEETPIGTPHQFREAVNGADMKKGMIVQLISDGKAKFELVKGSED